VEPHHCQQLAAVSPELEIVNAGQEGIANELPTADIFIGHAKVPVPWDDVVQAGRLQWIQSSAAGLDHCLVPAVIDSSIRVTSASGLFAHQVAEQTIALLAGIYRSLPTFYHAQQKKQFIRRPTRDLRGATIGIAGFGGNGRRIAEVMAGFETRILATDMYPWDCPSHVDQLWPAEKFNEMLPLVDVLILCVPLTPQTTGMIDHDALQKMRPGSVLINVARGPVVVERDLIDALQTSHLYAAGIDVTEIEPLPPNSPLWELPNVVITPHVGAQSARRVDDTTDLACENLRHFLDRQPLVNLVDKQLGYPARCPAG
jgi:D-3-phosphoglycerate dehydrogenase